MAVRQVRLGELLEAVDERNGDGALGEDAVVGLSTQKEIITTKADLMGVSLTTYKLFAAGDFAYVPDTCRRGDKMALAYNATGETYLISSIYNVFRIRRPDLLLSDYLFMYFNRPEFDRYARFNSWGSAREIFSFADLCDISLPLPPLPVQQKYAAVYTAMKANQKAFERGAEDIKRGCEAILDGIKHTAPYRAVGTLLEEVDCRNDDGHITDVQGINITKEFMPSVADVTAANLNQYKLVKSGQFAYSGMQTGRDKCIRIALYEGETPIIISPAYSVFKVKDDTILSEYIMLWFSRAESDRRGWFMSDGSIRANLDVDRFYETGLPLPPLPVQRAVADMYKVYKARKALAARMAAMIKDVCPALIRGSVIEGEERSIPSLRA